MRRLLLSIFLLCACGAESPDTTPPKPKVQIPLSGAGQAVIVGGSSSTFIDTPSAPTADSQDLSPVAPPDDIIREYIENDCIPSFKKVLENDGLLIKTEPLTVWAEYPYVELESTNPGRTWVFEVPLKDNWGFEGQVMDNGTIRRVTCQINVGYSNGEFITYGQNSIANYKPESQ